VSPEDKLVFTTDLCGKIAQQVKALGSAEAVLKRMFAPPCSYETARYWSRTVAQCFGMTQDEFMSKFREMRNSSPRS